MVDATTEMLLTSASNERDEPYINKRDAMIAEAKKDPNVMNSLQVSAADPSDWRKQITAQIIIGWSAMPGDFQKCTTYAKGDLPRPRPLPGFTTKHRAGAIAGLGPSVTPRVLEMVWKTREYADATESSALFGALELLKDQRAVLPMIDIIDERDDSLLDPQSSAISVLSRIDDPKGHNYLYALIEDITQPEYLRLTAIRVIGRIDSPKATEVLADILLRERSTEQERTAAAEGLGTRMDPSSREAVVKGLSVTANEETLLALVGILADIGTPEDIAPLEMVAGRSKLLRQAVNGSIEDINSRGSGN